jgi:hypothetical protein
MATEPIKVLDNLVKEAILTSYDFAWLTLAGFLIPFGNRIRYSWRAVLSGFCQIAFNCDPAFASNNDPAVVRNGRAETGGAEPCIAEQSRSWRAASGEREAMRGA